MRPPKKPRLVVRWSKAREHGISTLNGQSGDVVYGWGPGTSKSDSHMVHFWIAVGRWDNESKKVSLSLLQELHKRGYDLTTLRFQIDKRHEATNG